MLVLCDHIDGRRYKSIHVKRMKERREEERRGGLEFDKYLLLFNSRSNEKNNSSNIDDHDDGGRGKRSRPKGQFALILIVINDLVRNSKLILGIYCTVLNIKKTKVR